MDSNTGPSDPPVVFGEDGWTTWVCVGGSEEEPGLHGGLEDGRK